MKKTSKYILLLISVLMVGATFQCCKSKKEVILPPSGNPPLDISGIWVLSTFKGEQATNLFSIKLPVLNIDQYNKTISGNDGCNNFSGEFSFDNGVFTASKIASTLMACYDNNLDNDYQKILEAGCILKINNDDVMTLSLNGKTVATFQKGIDQALLYGSWGLTSLYGKDAAAYFETGNVPTIEFSVQEKRLGGFAGCNRYNSTYVIEGEFITIGPIVTTRMACAEMDDETKFLQALSDTSRIKVSDNKITFSKEGKVIAEFTRN